jgi:hypothetical protein
MVFGVMEFFNQDVQPPDEDLLDMASAVRYQIGDFFERQRTKKNLESIARRATAR